MMEGEALKGSSRQMELRGAHTRDGGAMARLEGERGMTRSVLNRCRREEQQRGKAQQVAGYRHGGHSGHNRILESSDI